VAGPEWTRVTAGPLAGHKLMLTLGAAPWQAEMRDGAFDAFIYDALAEHGPLAGKVFWDVGAHVGYHTLCFAALAGPEGAVVAFEPNLSNLDRLSANIERNADLAGRVRVMTCALSEHDGEASFVSSPNVDDGSSSGSGLENGFAFNREIDTSAAGRIQVRTARADALVANGSVPAPDIVKIDVEGGESFVLRGALGLLREAKPVLVIEVHNIVSMFHTLGLLFDLGYESRILDAEHSSASRCHIIAFPAQQA
jgi:FkbM family methyltransferase